MLCFWLRWDTLYFLYFQDHGWIRGMTNALVWCIQHCLYHTPPIAGGLFLAHCHASPLVVLYMIYRSSMRARSTVGSIDGLLDPDVSVGDTLTKASTFLELYTVSCLLINQPRCFILHAAPDQAHLSGCVAVLSASDRTTLVQVAKRQKRSASSGSPVSGVTVWHPNAYRRSCLKHSSFG